MTKTDFILKFPNKAFTSAQIAAMGKALGFKKLTAHYVSSVRTSRAVYENPKHRHTPYVSSLGWDLVLNPKL